MNVAVTVPLTPTPAPAQPDVTGSTSLSVRVSAPVGIVHVPDVQNVVVPTLNIWPGTRASTW